MLKVLVEGREQHCSSGLPGQLSKKCQTAHKNMPNGTKICQKTSGVKSILKLYLSKSIVTDGKTTRSKVESID